jgi:hypothetical protein
MQDRKKEEHFTFRLKQFEEERSMQDFRGKLLYILDAIINLESTQLYSHEFYLTVQSFISRSH